MCAHPEYDNLSTYQMLAEIAAARREAARVRFEKALADMRAVTDALIQQRRDTYRRLGVPEHLID